jgi:hypothetical protein
MKTLRNILCAVVVLVALVSLAQVPSRVMQDWQMAASGTSTAWTPASLGTGLKLWFSRDTLSGNDGTAIGKWDDSSGNNWWATNAATAAWPYVTNSSIFGHRVLRFSGSQALFVTTNAAAVSRNVGSLSIVCRVHSLQSASASTPFLISRNVAGSSRAYIAFAASGSVIRPFGRRLDTDSGQGANGGPYSAGVTYLLQADFLYSSSDANMYTNKVLSGTLTTFQTDGNTSDTDSVHITVGGVTAASETFNGFISDIVVCVPALTEQQRTNLWNYLSP